MSEITFDLAEATGRVCKRPNFGWKFISLDSVDSTNSYSKEHCAEFPVATLILAKHQTAGRGRGDHTWEDEAGTCFLATWTLELDEGAPDPRWTLGIGLYLFEALSEAFKSIRFSMKAPNDIYIGDKKVGGILVEATNEGDSHFLHVGVGLNVFSYPTEHSQIATHLNAYLGASSLTPETFGHFVEYFGSRLMSVERRAVDSEKAKKPWLTKLSPRLTEALNRHIAYAENPVKQVEADGSLTLMKGKIPWQQL